MRISILTGKFGMGHMVAAQAIREHIVNSSLDAEVEIVDWFDYISPKLADRFYSFFGLIVNRGCKFYNTRYRLLENRKTDQKPELYSYFKWHFKRYLEDKKPDIIISTLPTCSQITSLYKEKTGSSIPLITCVTDITGHSEWINKNTDFYMVGSYTVKDKFLLKGVLPNKIYVTGIPVRVGFSKNTTQEKECTRGRKKLLVMGGGLGILPFDAEFYNELDNLPNIEVTIITGKNNDLFQRLVGKYRNIHVLGFVDNVYDYMKQADAIVTKPGGVTTFEAIFAEVPILALNPFLQQEIYNAEYIQGMRIGTIINGTDKRSIQAISEILNNNQLNDYRYNIKRIKGRLQDNMMTHILEEAVKLNNKNFDLDIAKHQFIEGGNGNETISFNI